MVFFYLWIWYLSGSTYVRKLTDLNKALQICLASSRSTVAFSLLGFYPVQCSVL